MRRGAKAIILGVAAVGLGLAGAFACSRPASPRVVVGVVELPTIGLFFIAGEQGHFRAEGLEVVRRVFPTGRDALAALAAGEVDVAIAYETPIAIRAFDVPALRVLTTLHSSTSSTRVVALAGRGIASGADLRAQRVGVARGTNNEFFLDELLAFSGVRADEIRRQDLPFPALASALARGDVDAVSASFPYAHGGELAPDKVVEIRSAAYTEFSVLVTRADVIASRRDALVRMLRGLVRAERFAEEGPDQAIASLERGMPGTPAALVREGWSRAAPQLGLSHVLLTMLGREAEWHRARSGRAAPAPDFRQLLAPTLLEEVQPEAVTILDGEER